MEQIHIRGARTHNLKNIDLTLPRDRLIVITGLSGSGKSSLAFDTIYAEGQRRYVESLSAYARQFLSMMEKPDVDHIEGLSPAISIEQKTTSHNPRSTVGTITEIYDYLRLLFARVGTPRCPTARRDTGGADGRPDGRPGAGAAGRQQAHAACPGDLRTQGRVPQVAGRAARPGLHPRPHRRRDLRTRRPTRAGTAPQAHHRGRGRPLQGTPDLRLRLAESFETALHLSDGVVRVAGWTSAEDDQPELVFSANFACPVCGYSIEELEPRLFSFNNPVGACPTCDGLGVEQFFDPAKVVANPELSLGGGAVRGWDRRNAYYYQMIRSLARTTDSTRRRRGTNCRPT
jgi:excinuclease ABC subunit A